MRKYKWSDMLYTYEWSRAEKNNPIYSVPPGDDAFNVKSGHAILSLINHFIENKPDADVETGHKAEFLLHETLPPGKYSLAQALHFLEMNF